VKRLGNLPGVTVTGSVADVRPYLGRSALMLAPLNIARGTQNKILEAMASGVPWSPAAWRREGWIAVANEHFLVASTPEQYALAVLRILDHPAERRRLAIAGRDRMLSHHLWIAQCGASTGSSSAALRHSAGSRRGWTNCANVRARRFRGVRPIRMGDSCADMNMFKHEIAPMYCSQSWRGSAIPSITCACFAGNRIRRNEYDA